MKLHEILKIMLIVLVAAQLTSCRVNKLVDKKVTKTKSDSTYSEKRKVNVLIPGQSLSFESSLGKVHFIHVPGKTETIPCVEIKSKMTKIHTKDGKLMTQFKVDSLGNYAILTDQKNQELLIEVEDQKRVIKEYEKEVLKYQEQDTIIGKLIKETWWVLIIILIAFFLLNIGIEKFKKAIL